MGTPQLKPFPLGYDVLNAQGLIAHAQRLRDAGYYFTVMTFVGSANAGAARSFKDFSPETLVIYRPYPDHDLPTRFPEPAAFYDWVGAQLEGDKRIAVQVMNEPSLQDEAAFKMAVGWLLSAIPVSTALGWQSVFINWGAGHPVLPNSHDLLHPFYIAMQGTAHLLGQHEYAFQGGAVTNSLIGRVSDMWHYCQAHGLKPLRSVDTEGGWDLPGVKETGKTDREYSQALKGYWNDWGAPYGKVGISIYAWGKDGAAHEGEDWGEYNVADMGAFHDEQLSIAGELTPPAPLPEPQAPETPGEGEPETPVPSDVAARLAAAEAEIEALHILATRLTQAVNTLTETLHAVADVLSLVQTI